MITEDFSNSRRDAYEWFFVRLTDGDSIQNPFKYISGPNRDYFDVAKHDWQTIIEFCRHLKEGVTFHSKLVYPKKAYENFMIYKEGIINELDNLGYQDFTDDVEDFLLKQAALNESFKKRRYLLTEADKTRFIRPIWANLEPDVMSYIGLDGKEVPTESEIIKWVNSGAADKYKINWQAFDPKKGNWTTEAVATDIIKPYLEYSSEKALKRDPKTNFQNKDDFEILFENDDYLFVGLKTYEAAHFCDSFKCGGAGAKWCIGYDRQHWNFYNIKEESRFVLAYSKKRHGDMNDQKYMIEILQSGSCKVWSQVDRVKFKSTAIEKTCEYFSITEQDLLNWYSKLYGSTPFDTVRSVSMNQVFEGQVIKIDDSAKDVVLTDLDTQPSFEYANLCQGVKFGKNSRVLRVNGEGGVLRLEKLILGAKAYSEQAIVQKSLITDFVITNYSKVVIDELWLSKSSPKLTFTNCSSVEVGTLYLPNGFDPEDDQLSNMPALLREYNDYARGIEVENLQLGGIRFFPVSDICNTTTTKDGWDVLGKRAVENILNGKLDRELLTGYTKVFIDFDGDVNLFRNDSFDLGSIVANTPNGIIWCLNVPLGCEVTYDKQPDSSVYVKYCI